MNFPKPAVGMLPNDRLAYSAIPNRKPLKLPKGARMVVWVNTNVEEWDPTQTMPRTVLTPPAGGSPMPDIPNWCWHEYGNRVGFWRLLQVYDEFKIPGVMNINGTAALAYGIARELVMGLEVELADGRFVHGFLCEAHALTQAQDISRFGGWRAYLASL